MEEHIFEENLFGEKVKIMVYDVPKALALKASKKAFKDGLKLQKIFNFYDGKSELSKLNKKRKLKVSDEFLEVLKKSLEMSKSVKGYDVSLGKKFLERKKGNLINISCSHKDIKIKKNFVSLENENVLIDLGSIAKGFVTDKMGEVLKKNKVREFLIDSRGDILFGGDSVKVIEIEHPRKDGESIGQVKVTNEAVATSGDYKQFSENFENSHLLNKSEIISATVVSPTLEIADLLATAFCVSSKREREDLIMRNPKIKYFLVDKELNITKSNDF